MEFQSGQPWHSINWLICRGGETWIAQKKRDPTCFKQNHRWSKSIKSNQRKSKNQFSKWFDKTSLLPCISLVSCCLEVICLLGVPHRCSQARGVLQSTTVPNALWYGWFYQPVPHKKITQGNTVTTRRPFNPIKNSPLTLSQNFTHTHNT